MTTAHDTALAITGWGGSHVRQAVILAGGQASRLSLDPPTWPGMDLLTGF
ncbi:hypothetical protein [Streptomyces sp. CA-106110]